MGRNGNTCSTRLAYIIVAVLSFILATSNPTPTQVIPTPKETRTQQIYRTPTPRPTYTPTPTLTSTPTPRPTATSTQASLCPSGWNYELLKDDNGPYADACLQPFTADKINKSGNYILVFINKKNGQLDTSPGAWYVGFGHMKVNETYVDIKRWFGENCEKAADYKDVVRVVGPYKSSETPPWLFFEGPDDLKNNQKQQKIKFRLYIERQFPGALEVVLKFYEMTEETTFKLCELQREDKKRENNYEFNYEFDPTSLIDHLIWRTTELNPRYSTIPPFSSLYLDRRIPPFSSLYLDRRATRAPYKSSIEFN